MFVTQDAELAMPFGTASLRLANMIRSGSLADASSAAYQGEQEAMLRVGPAGDFPATTRLVRVRFLEPVYSDDSLHIGMRWEATGATAGLFPVLDADITVTSSGEHSSTLTIAGVYRPPLGRLGAGLDKAGLNRIATATIRRLLQQLAETAMHPAGTPDIQHMPAGEPALQPVIPPTNMGSGPVAPPGGN